jgi:hypothetical protein
MCDHETSTKRGGPGPYKTVEPYEKKKVQQICYGGNRKKMGFLFYVDFKTEKL